VTWARIAVIGVALVLGAVVLSGGSADDPRTPAAMPGLPPPFLGTTVLGNGGLTAAIDSYGDVVDLRLGPAGAGLIDNPTARQAAGTVPPDTGIVARVSVAGGPPLPLWRADRVRQRYLPGTNVLRTEARFGRFAVRIEDAASGSAFARLVEVSDPSGNDAQPLPGRVELSLQIPDELDRELDCRQQSQLPRLALICRSGMAKAFGSAKEPMDSAPDVIAASVRTAVAASARDDQSWIGRALRLGAGAPPWARNLYRRSLLVLRAFTDRRTGAVAAGAREGWAYVWPRDAGAVALALAAAGYRTEAQRIARFLLGLNLDAAARFNADGSPIEGRDAQGDAWGWAMAAAQTAGLAANHSFPSAAASHSWRDRADYQEKSPALYLGNALASPTYVTHRHESINRTNVSPVDGPETDAYRRKSAHQRKGGRIRELFGARGVLTREAEAPSSGIDSAAAWAVRPFRQPALFPMARHSLQRLVRERGGRYGLVPSEDWHEEDPWTAPTAWSAWALAALANERQVGPVGEHRAARPGDRAALGLLTTLRRAATPVGMLPERVDAHTGVPRSTTPLAWSHAFAVLALRELWPAKKP
jgi:glucoamylase